MLSLNAPQTQPAVLLVENNRPTLELYRRELSNEFEVWACQDEQTAFDWLSDKQFHVVILEPSMNHGKGWDLFVKIRECGGNHAIPVILVSTSDEWKNFREINSATFLLKPVLPAMLHETVRNLLRQD